MVSRRPGWRWCDGGLWFCEELEKVDRFKTPTERTRDAMVETLGGLVYCLDFTIETSEDFSNGWLPTLDISMRVSSMNQIEYQFYEKLMASKMCFQANTALTQNGLVQSLIQDIFKRMLNCSSHIPI